MTNREFESVLMNLTITSMMLIEMYPKEEDLINSWLDDIATDESLKVFVLNLLAFCEAKEDFEICADLLNLKNKIK